MVSGLTTDKRAHPWERLNSHSICDHCSSLSRNETPLNFHPSTLICPLIWSSLVCTTFSRKDCSPSRFSGILSLTIFLPLLPQCSQNHRCRGSDFDVSIAVGLPTIQASLKCVQLWISVMVSICSTYIFSVKKGFFGERW